MEYCSDNYIPVCSTILRSDVPPTIDDTHSYNFGFMDVRSGDGRMVIVLRRGVTHFSYGDNGVMVLCYSDDGGCNWSRWQEVFSESSMDIRNYGGGFLPDGRLLVAYTRAVYDSGCQWLVRHYGNYYIIIDSDLSGYEGPYAIVETEEGGLCTFGGSPYGRWLKAGDEYWIPSYHINKPDQIYSTGYYRFTADGTYIGYGEIDVSSERRLTENSIAFDSNGNAIAMVREDTGWFSQYRKLSGSAGWEYQGRFKMWIYATSGMPPHISTVHYNGDDYVFFYLPKRISGYSGELRVFIKRFSSALSGVSWSLLTHNYVLLSLDQYDSGLGYHTFYHPNNRLFGLGYISAATIRYNNRSQVAFIVLPLGVLDTILNVV